MARADPADRDGRPVVAVGAVVIAPGPLVLLIRRARPPKLGIYSLPGGKVLAGETLAQALVREVHEETGVAVVAGPLIEIVELMSEGYHYVIHDHLCAPIDREAAPRAGDDASDARYVTPADLASLGVDGEAARVIQKALAMRFESPQVSQKAKRHDSTEDE